jgi:endoglucanase
MLRTRPRLALLAAAIVPLVLSAATTPVPKAIADTSDGSGASHPSLAANPDNPLANRAWGVYKGKADQAWEPYDKSTGEERELLGKIALRPRATWFGAWTANSDIRAKVEKYVANMSGGDPDKLVQMAVFRVKPWEHKACERIATDDERASYRQWIRLFAKGVGAQHAAIIVQPDGPFALCAPGGSKRPSRMVGYAVKKFAALPNTAVYIDAGASDWPDKKPERAADILMPASIRLARGFALDATHYTSTGDNVAYGTKVVAELASRGVPGKHFVINTAQNGAPFTWNQKRTDNFDNSPVCENTSMDRCVTLGIPPTTDVANSRWGLSATNESRAAKHVDGYLWFGRPWLYMQADPFVKSRALQLARTTPY